MNAQIVKSAKGSVRGDLNEKSIFLNHNKIRTIKTER
jgi:hypothetical protein